MPEQAVVNTRGKQVDERALQQLKARLRGPLLRPGDAGYDDARKLWNAMIDKRPACIVRCTGAADVMDAVRFAREHDLLLAVRGGGHNIAGTALCDGGMVVDLSALRGVHVDVKAGTARVQPGCAWGDVDRETQPFGYAVPNGIVSTTGVAGLTLGGGFGWLTRKYGYTCDNLLSVDVVTAEGELVTASEAEHPDLFWGVRGGGGNFGVVTSFQYRMQRAGPPVVAGLALYPMAQAREVAAFFREFTAAAPEELTALLILRIAPPAPFLPKEVHGAPVAAIAVCYAGPVEEGEAAVRPLKAFGRPLVDQVGPKPFAVHQTMLDTAQPPGRYYYWKSEYVGEVSGGLAETLAAHTAEFPSPQTSVLVMHLGGAAARVGEAATAVSLPRRDAYVLNVAGSWVEPERQEGCIGWVRGLWSAARPFALGATYINFQTADEGEERVRAAYGPATYRRLAALKDKYDPTNLFRVNQNVRPAAGAGRG